LTSCSSSGDICSSIEAELSFDEIFAFLAVHMTKYHNCSLNFEKPLNFNEPEEDVSETTTLSSRKSSTFLLFLSKELEEYWVVDGRIVKRMVINLVKRSSWLPHAS
jgi:hypothetical protein